jgi:hypothetical protein
MHNAAVVARMRIPQTDRFDTVLPKEERFFNSPPTKPKKATDWHGVIITGIIAVTFIAAIKQLKPTLSPAGVTPVATPAAPLPDPKPVHGQVPVPRLLDPVQNPASAPPRAQLVHIRAIGTFENDMMPDGRIVGTTYRGELPSAANLPRTGGQIGDMWFTRADGHAWVLAPIAGGSQTVGWIDP